MSHSSVEAVRPNLYCLCPSVWGTFSYREQENPRILQHTSRLQCGQGLERCTDIQGEAQLSQDHAGTAHTPGARGLWYTGSLLTADRPIL